MGGAGDGLEAVYGAPSDAGFGSAVFRGTAASVEALEAAALAQYRSFVGAQWERFGEAAWMSGWRRVYERPAGAARDVVAELRGLADPAARSSAGLLLEAGDDPGAAQRALATAFDDLAVTHLLVHALGDGAAMAGVELSACTAEGRAVFLVLLMD